MQKRTLILPSPFLIFYDAYTQLTQNHQLNNYQFLFPILFTIGEK